MATWDAGRMTKQPPSSASTSTAITHPQVNRPLAWTAIWRAFSSATSEKRCPHSNRRFCGNDIVSIVEEVHSVQFRGSDQFCKIGDGAGTLNITRHQGFAGAGTRVRECAEAPWAPFVRYYGMSENVNKPCSEPHCCSSNSFCLSYDYLFMLMNRLGRIAFGPGGEPAGSPILPGTDAAG